MLEEAKSFFKNKDRTTYPDDGSVAGLSSVIGYENLKVSASTYFVNHFLISWAFTRFYILTKIFTIYITIVFPIFFNTWNLQFYDH